MATSPMTGQSPMLLFVSGASAVANARLERLDHGVHAVPGLELSRVVSVRSLRSNTGVQELASGGLGILGEYLP
jgi:hypothetical protein